MILLGVYAFLGAAFAAGLTGCSDSDPDYNNVEPPTVTVSNSISGCISGMDGKGISAATVSLDGKSSQTTNSDGTFVFEDVTAGNHTITATSTGKQTKEATVTVPESEKGSNVVWNVSLPNEGTTVAVKANEETTATVATETLEGNEQAAVTVDVTIPANAVPEGSSITITPTYSLDEATTRAAQTRATETVLLIGTTLACSNPNATLASPIQLAFNVDAEVAQSVTAQKSVNGQWMAAEFKVEGSQVTVTVDQFATYVLQFSADVTSSKTTTSISFSQSEWNNLYGASSMTVGSASYTYKIGTERGTADSSRATAYLTEILSRLAGASVTTATGSYPINVTLPIGTALTVSGTQEVTTHKVSAFGRSVSCQQYGNVNVTTSTYNRAHNGGNG